MCGIGGYIKKSGVIDEADYEAIKKIALTIESRGTDAFGFIAIDTNGNVSQLWKFPSKFSDHIEMAEDIIKNFMLGSKAVLIHTRAYTSGSPLKNCNNHPFKIDNYYLAHNGYTLNNRYIVYYNSVATQKYNYRLEQTKKLPKWADKRIETDSYVDLFVPLAKKLKDDDSALTSAEKFYELASDIMYEHDVIGTFWLYDEKTKKLAIMVDSMPFEYKVTNDIIMFASELPMKCRKIIAGSMVIDLTTYDIDTYEPKIEYTYYQDAKTNKKSELNDSNYYYDYYHWG